MDSIPLDSVSLEIHSDHEEAREFGVPKHKFMDEDDDSLLLLHHLIYVNEASEYEPFTARQFDAFAEGRRKDSWADRGVCVGGSLSIVFAAIAGGLTITKNFVPYPWPIVLDGGALCCGTLSPTTGCLLASCLVHRAGQARGRDQGFFEDAKDMYTEMGRVLRKLSKSEHVNDRIQAAKIAANLHVNTIHKVMLHSLDETRCVRLLRPLRRAHAEVFSRLENNPLPPQATQHSLMLSPQPVFMKDE